MGARDKKRQFALFAASDSPPVVTNPILQHYPEDGSPPAKRRATSPRLSSTMLRELIVKNTRQQDGSEVEEEKEVKEEYSRAVSEVRSSPVAEELFVEAEQPREEVEEEEEEYSEEEDHQEEEYHEEEPEDYDRSAPASSRASSSAPSSTYALSHSSPLSTALTLPPYHPPAPSTDHDALLLTSQLLSTLPTPPRDPLLPHYLTTRATLTQTLYTTISTFLDHAFTLLTFDLSALEIENLRTLESALQESLDLIWASYQRWRRLEEDRLRQEAEQRRRAAAGRPWWETTPSTRRTTGNIHLTPSAQLGGGSVDLARLSPSKVVVAGTGPAEVVPVVVGETPLARLIAKIVRTGFSELLRYAEGALEDQRDCEGWCRAGRRAVEERMRVGWKGTLEDVRLCGRTVVGMVEGVMGFGGVREAREDGGGEEVGRDMDVDGGVRAIEGVGEDSMMEQERLDEREREIERDATMEREKSISREKSIQREPSTTTARERSTPKDTPLPKHPLEISLPIEHFFAREKPASKRSSAASDISLLRDHPIDHSPPPTATANEALPIPESPHENHHSEPPSVNLDPDFPLIRTRETTQSATHSRAASVVPEPEKREVALTRTSRGQSRAGSVAAEPVQRRTRRGRGGE